ncbi:ABC transporter permease [Roseateles sp. DB2]|uniref:ABC transporter permease n=1 Tax=Roseateles sp. DB2 TaxID=3453717 RepID=UPI003EEB4F6E
MTRLWRHSLNEARRGLWLARRYWVETLLGLGFLVSLFGGLVYAVLKASGQSLDSGRADGLIAGFALWLFASGTAHAGSKEIMEETRQRTLEQLNLAPLSLASLLAIRLVLGLAVSLLLLVLSLLLIGGLTEGRVQTSPEVLALALLGCPALAGIGYAMAGLSLLVKHGELLMVAAYPVVIALVSLPAYPVSELAWLPYALAAAGARAAATGTLLSADVWAWVALNGGAWLALGLLCFRACLDRARRLGVLGHL